MIDFQQPFPAVYQPTNCSGRFKLEFEDFKVDEDIGFEPSGEGEHLFVHIEKTNTNTQWLARRLSNHAQIRLMDVGYAGLKDRHGVTTQWFSLYMGNRDNPDLTHVNNDEIKILKQARHNRKLRKGELLGNQFSLILHLDSGDKDQLDQRLREISEQGYPNYFGDQRFGHDRGNLARVTALFNEEFQERNKQKRGILLSSARSWLFNLVLKQRIEKGNWNQLLEGDVATEDGLPTGPMWGRGRLTTSAEIEQLEMAVADAHPLFKDKLEHLGMSQERRPLAVKPKELSWNWLSDNKLELKFFLGAGYYATSLIRELGEFSDASIKNEDAE